MVSHSSSDHPESSHPYHTNQSRLTTSLELQSHRRTFLSRFLPSSRREGLLPLPEGARLSSSSPPPLLLRISHTPLDLPHPASMPITEITTGDLTWATTPEPLHPTIPVTILGMSTLQHPQPRLAQASSGIISPFHTAPTSPPLAMAHPITEPPHQHQSTDRSEGLPWSGTNLSRPQSRHLSLYKQLRNLSLAPQPFAAKALTGRMLASSHPPSPEGDAPIEQVLGSNSPEGLQSSHSLHRSYSCPLSHDMDVSPVRQATQTPFMSAPSPVLQHCSPTPLPMEFQDPLNHPPSRRSCQTTPVLPPMMLTDAIHFYERTATDLSVAIPVELKQAEYHELYNYFAYKLPFILTWGETQAGNDYFMKKQRGIPADDILQYKAERNTCLLYNQIHRDAPMEVLAPYKDIVAEADIQMPMPDEPPVPPPRAPVTAFSYIRGQEPPGTYPSGYRPFAGAGSQSGSGGQPAQPLQPPAPPQRWALPCHPAPPKAPTPPAPWVLTAGNVAPYNDFKPKILKEVNNFKGDSNDISQFFLKCELHFEVFNQHFRYPPHKVIFCIS